MNHIFFYKHKLSSPLVHCKEMPVLGGRVLFRCIRLVSVPALKILFNLLVYLNQMFKEKKNPRESFVCGACGQVCKSSSSSSSFLVFPLGSEAAKFIVL